MKAPKIIKVEYIGNYSLSLTFNNGKTKQIDLAEFVCGFPDNPHIVKLKSYKEFAKAKIDHGHLMWGNMVDIAAEDLYCGKVGKLIYGDMKSVLA